MATCLLLIVITALLLGFGGGILVVPNPLPQHAQVAVALSGSLIADRARQTQALRFVEQGLTDYAMLTVPRTGYWGQHLPDVAQCYIQKRFGPSIAQRVALCVIDENVDSTAAEAVALRGCLEERG